MFGVSAFGHEPFGKGPEPLTGSAGLMFGTGDVDAVGTNASKSARVSQFAIEVLADNQDAQARVSQFAIEVLMDLNFVAAGALSGSGLLVGTGLAIASGTGALAGVGALTSTGA